MAWLPQKKKTTTTTATKHNRHRVTGTAQLESELACRVVRYFDLVRGEMNGARRTSSAIYGHLWMSATVNAAGIRNNGKFWFAVGDCTLSLSLFLLSADVSVSLSEQLFSCVCWGKRDFFLKLQWCWIWKDGCRDPSHCFRSSFCWLYLASGKLGTWIYRYSTEVSAGVRYFGLQDTWLP